MLSIGKIQAGPEAGDYYTRQVAQGREDYYGGEGDGERPGRWFGSGARGLGLDGEVEDGHPTLMLAGRDPASGDRLGREMGERSVAGFDLTFKAPKSVSVLYGVGDPELADALMAGHDAALAEAMAYLEREACGARRGHGGIEKVQGNGFVAAAFQHRSSRAADPLLHTHIVVLNRVQGPDGRWTALDGQRLFAHAKTAGCVYQAALRTDLRERLGLAWGEVERGVAEVEGVPREVSRHFSKRRQEIERAMHERGARSMAAAAAATLATRRRKDTSIPVGELRASWRERAGALGFGQAAVEQTLDRAPEHAAIAEVCVDDLTLHAATFDRRDVVQAVCAAHRDGTSHAQIQAEADRLLHSPEVVPLQRASGALAFTTASVLEAELRLEHLATAGREAGRAVAREDLVAAALERRDLEGEQAGMVRSLTADGHAIHVVRAPAGAGKTFALEAAREAWARSGVEVMGCALSAAAARELREQAAIDATTVSRLRHKLDHGDQLPRGGVLVVDEAGMVGTRDLAALADAADHVRCKLVLVGDDRQLPEIEAGGSFRALAGRSSTELTTLRRQVDQEERDALEALRAGRTREWARSLDDRGRLVTADTADQLRERLVDDWYQARTGGHDAIMLAHRRRDVADLNDRARDRLRADDQLSGPDVTLGERTYAVGDHVVCRHNDTALDVINGDRGTIEQVDHGHARIRLDNDREVHLPADYAAEHLDHGYAITTHRAQGSTVDRAFVLGSDELDREWGYTAMTRHRDEARFYICAPQTFLNQRARPLAEHEELVDRVTQLFENSGAQQRALDALDRDPRAAQTVRALERQLEAARQRDLEAAELQDARNHTSVLRRGRRDELDRDRARAAAFAAHAREQAALLRDQLTAAPEREPLSIPAHEPPMPHLPAPSLDRDIPIDSDFDLGW